MLIAARTVIYLIFIWSSMRTDQNFDDFEKFWLEEASPSNYSASFIGNSFVLNIGENLNHAVEFLLFSMKKRYFFWRTTQLMHE